MLDSSFFKRLQVKLTSFPFYSRSQSVIDMQSPFLRNVPIVPLFSLSGCTTYWYRCIIIKGMPPYKNGSMFWRSRSLWLKNGAFLPVKYLEIFAIIRLFTSYSKDKRRKEAKYWSLSRKVKGQHSCNSLVALSFWQNISTPLNHRYIYLCKHVKDDDLKTPRTSKDKKVIGQGQ